MSLIPPGNPAPDFRLPDLDGRLVALTDFLALGPVWLVFYKGSCPTCRLGVPYLQRLMDVAENPEGSVLLVAEDRAEAVHSFVSEFGLTLPVLVESEPWPVSTRYGLSTVPTSYFIEGDGTISAAVEGFVRAEWEALARNLAARSGHPEFALFTANDNVPAFKPG